MSTVPERTVSDGPDIASLQPLTGRGFLVAEVQVDGLFDRHSYRISPLTSEAARRGGPPLMLLYGENGSGKTTILRILWHLLSPADNRSHRSSLARIPFRSAFVRLGNGDAITLTKADALIGSYSISVTRRRGENVEQRYLYDPADRKVRSANSGFAISLADINTTTTTMQKLWATTGWSTKPPDEPYRIVSPVTETDAYIDYLQTLEVVPFMLGDDRLMYSDSQSGDVDERLQRLAMLQHSRGREESILALELSDAITRASNQIRREQFSGVTAGSQNVDQVYRDVLTQLAKKSIDPEKNQTLAVVSKALTDLARRTKTFTEFGLAPAARVDPLIDLLKSMDDASRQELAIHILTPYIESQNKRLDSLQETQELISRFVSNIQRYFSPDKRVTFTISDGLQIREARAEYLNPEQLSSGERQLLLLLCSALLARRSTSLFLIDEPELSLNASWQRHLVRSLLEITSGANVQFIMATHSIQIISQYEQYLARLGRVDS
jgi:energy-coupling factor transporter ATP-binding protein EcfA2